MNAQIIKAKSARPVHNRGTFGQFVNVIGGLAMIAGSKGANGWYSLHKSFTREQEALIAAIPCDTVVWLSLSADGETILSVTVPQGVQG